LDTDVVEGFPKWKSGKVEKWKSGRSGKVEKWRHSACLPRLGFENVLQ
jgi:hypothetical protein